MLDGVPRDVMLIVYRYVFDYNYSRVIKEYFGNCPYILSNGGFVYCSLAIEKYIGTSSIYRFVRLSSARPNRQFVAPYHLSPNHFYTKLHV